MKLVQNDPRIEAYLEDSDIIDFKDPAIQALASKLRHAHADRSALICASFEWVRDQIAHSWDAQEGPVTLRASEVLRSGYGYCYAKSHLLAALLRANGIPTGLCYQRLSIGDLGGPYCLHGLNAVLLPEHGWFRIDARGNKSGVDAAFTPPVERLAFQLKDEQERDFSEVLAEPLPAVVESLRTQPDIFSLHDNLPDAMRIGGENLQHVDPLGQSGTKES
jgi:transglutaminase-like putative cysteine protease